MPSPKAAGHLVLLALLRRRFSPCRRPSPRERTASFQFVSTSDLQKQLLDKEKEELAETAGKTSGLRFRDPGKRGAAPVLGH